MPTICINKSGSNIPVYNTYQPGRYVIGYINHLDIYTMYGYSGEVNAINVNFYSGGWKTGYIIGNPSASVLEPAFAGKYGSVWGSGYKFPVLHRQSRIFSGANVITAVQPGGSIITNGASDGGSSYPYRLSILGYISGGVYKAVTNGWCDTDIEIGCDRYNTCTIDGTWV